MDKSVLSKLKRPGSAQQAGPAGGRSEDDELLDLFSEDLPGAAAADAEKAAESAERAELDEETIEELADFSLAELEAEVARRKRQQKPGGEELMEEDGGDESSEEFAGKEFV